MHKWEKIMNEVILGTNGGLDESHRQKILTFKLDEGAYGIPIAYVREIIGLPAITHMPELPNFVKGIINLRDKIIPVIAIREKFKMAPRAFDDRTCVIIVHLFDLDFGLIVDTISEVMDFSTNEIVPPPPLSTQEEAYIESIGIMNHVVTLIIDCKTILKKEEIALIKTEI